jgi:hypothetical protein
MRTLLALDTVGNLGIVIMVHHAGTSTFLHAM